VQGVAVGVDDVVRDVGFRRGVGAISRRGGGCHVPDLFRLFRLRKSSWSKVSGPAATPETLRPLRAMSETIMFNWIDEKLQ
jgi:hypothetical protein